MLNHHIVTTSLEDCLLGKAKEFQECLNLIGDGFKEIAEPLVLDMNRSNPFNIFKNFADKNAVEFYFNCEKLNQTDPEKWDTLKPTLAGFIGHNKNLKKASEVVSSELKGLDKEPDNFSEILESLKNRSTGFGRM